VQDILDQYGVKWIATQEDYNTTTSNGRLMLNLKLSIAQNESDQTGDRIRFVYAGKLRRKEAIGGRVTFGYKIENHKYVIDEPQAAIVRAIFLYFSMYQSIAKTQQYINDTHNIKLLAARIRHILGNERYIGRFFDVDGYAPPIVDFDLWERVQKILAIGRRAETPRTPKEIYLFSGLLFCPSCSGRMNGLNPRKVKYYRCRTAGVNHLCDFNKCIRESFVENYLLDNIEEQANQYAGQLEVNAKEIEDNTNKIQSATARLNRLKDLYVNGFIDRQTYEKDFKTYNAELTQAKRANKKKPPNLQGILSNGIAALYKGLSLEGKKTFWRSIIHRLELTTDLNINIVFL
jgi:hypothetical protein